MSELARAVSERLKETTSAQDIESILRSAGITTSAAVPTPVRLRVLDVQFSGMKRLEQAGGSRDEPVVAEEPFGFSWKLGPGLFVISSHENLRGKSSVLEVIRWALRGRCRLQADVRSWLDRVMVAFQVGEERLVVAFDVRDGQAEGSVFREDTPRGLRVELAAFAGEDAFERTMDAVMMPRLHLQRIVARQDEQAVEHAWVAYAGALSISSRGLDQLLGDVQFGGMASRLLSMFLGAAWAASRSEAATAAKLASADLERLQRQADQRQQTAYGQRETSARAVAEARAALEALPDGDGRLQEAAAAVTRVAELGAEIATLQVQLDNLGAVEREARRQLQEEEARQHALLEDALGRRFFNALRPSACPRCAAPVTDERRTQESRGHQCSVCTTELDLEAYEREVLVAASAPAGEREAALRSANLVDGSQNGDGHPSTDGTVALRRAAGDAARSAGRVEAELQARVRQRDEAAEVARAGAELAELAERRRAAELAVARAEGALDALAPSTPTTELDEREVLNRRLKVLKAAEAVTAAWVRDSQRDALRALSERIAELGRAFGIPQLTSVELDGGARMKIHKGGADTTYSKCVTGEQLRLKVATAVALLRAGFASQIGRHPGLLTVDSPGSEEATQESLEAMLRAIQQVAADAPDMQVIVATTRAQSLEDFLSPEHRRIAPPGGYLW